MSESEITMECSRKGASLGDPGYIMQRKYDGTRCLTTKSDNSILMIGRSEAAQYNNYHPQILNELKQLPVNCKIDGELTFFNKDGVDKFLSALSLSTTHVANGLTPYLMVFDLLSVDGYDITKWPIEKRLEGLEAIINSRKYNHIKLVETYRDPSQFKAIYDKIIESGGEGVVLKRLGSPYVVKSRDYWTKIKRFDTADCIISGITIGEGARADRFGAVILSQIRNGIITHVGNASGFDNRTLEVLYKSVMSLPEGSEPANYTKNNELKFVQPQLVAEIRYMNRTNSGKLRHPVFVRLRDDKPADQCVMEEI